MSIKRYFLENGLYHLITKGNNKQDIFLYKKDYLRYLYYLEKYSRKFFMKILAFCLMRNHTHLLIRQETSKSTSDFMHTLNTAYTMYFNSKHSTVGHLFQGPFRHISVETDEYLVHLSRYIHLNPTSAGLVKKPGDYQWSSYRHYLGLDKLIFVDEKLILSYFSKENPVEDYKNFTKSRIDYQKDVNLQKLFLE